MDLEPMATDPMVPTPTTGLMDTTLLARGPLMLSPLLMLMLTTDTTAMLVPMPMATDPMVPTPTTGLMDTTLLARGLLMLSQLLMLMPIPTELDTTVTIEPSHPTKDPPKIKTSSHKQ